MDLASYIDHTALKADTTSVDIARLCEEAIQHRFHSVCVNGSRVREAAALLRGSPVKVAAVTGFPLGAMSPKAKAFETASAVEDGAQEIDTVIAVGALKERNFKLVLADLRSVVIEAKPAIVKVILETGLLTDEEKRMGCQIATEAGAAFVKTSTGFGAGGATQADVRLMADVMAGKALVKASGGIRDRAAALAMIEAGAARIGTSSGIAIVSGGVGTTTY
jgi:deoxyribose-phosphate aldolase